MYQKFRAMFKILIMSFASGIFNINSQEINPTTKSMPVSGMFHLPEPIKQRECFEDYSCTDSVCRPNQGYRSYVGPRTKIFTNFLMSYEDGILESIDLNKMTITFSPTKVMVWQDNRLKFCNVSANKRLDDQRLLREIWSLDT